MTDVLRKALEPFAAIKMGDDADCKTEIVPNGYSDPRDWRNHIKQARAALTQPEPAVQQEDETVRCSKCDNPDMRMCDCSLPSRVEPTQQGGEEGVSRIMDAIVEGIMSMDRDELMKFVTPEDISTVKSTIADAIAKAAKDREALSSRQAAGEAEAVALRVAAEIPAAIELWFFRDLGETQRRQLINWCGFPGVEANGEDFQRKALRSILSAIATPQPTETQRIVAWQPIGEWREVEQNMMLKGLRRSPKYYPVIGEVCRVSGPNCDDADGYTWLEKEVLWRDELFIVTRSKGCWPTITKLELALFEPLPTSGEHLAGEQQ